MNDANTNIEAADVDDIVVNVVNEHANQAASGNDNQLLLTERLTVHNVVIDRTLEEGLPSQNVRVRSLPVLKNDGIYDAHDWLHQDTGSLDEMEKRYRENNSDTPNSRDDTAIKNDKTLWRNSTTQNIPAIAKFARYCFCLVASSAAAERVLSTLKSGLSLVQLQKCLEEFSEIATMLQYNKSGDCEDILWQKIEKVKY